MAEINSNSGSSNIESANKRKRNSDEKFNACEACESNRDVVVKEEKEVALMVKEFASMYRILSQLQTLVEDMLDRPHCASEPVEESGNEESKNNAEIEASQGDDENEASQSDTEDKQITYTEKISELFAILNNSMDDHWKKLVQRTKNTQ